MKKHLLFGLILLSGLSITSCKKENGGGNLSYRLKAVSSISAGASTSAQGLGVKVIVTPVGLNWESGYVNVSEIKFQAKRNDLEVSYKSKGLANVNLFDISPVISSITLPEGQYDKVKLKVEIKQERDKPALFLKGSYTDGNNNKVPVELYLNEGENEFEIEVEAKNIMVDSKFSYTGLISLHLDRLIDGITASDLAAATKTNGTIVISTTSNLKLYSKIKANANHFSDCDFNEQD